MMIPCDRSFDGKSFYECGGKTFYRWYYIDLLGDYRLRFKFISSNSVYAQGIALFFSDFKGQILLNGRYLDIPEKAFEHYVFDENEMSNGGVLLVVHAENGELFFGNASERPETKIFTCGAFGNAFWIETISSNCLRFHCNDHEYDDDFEDFVFDLEIETN